MLLIQKNWLANLGAHEKQKRKGGQAEIDPVIYSISRQTTNTICCCPCLLLLPLPFFYSNLFEKWVGFYVISTRENSEIVEPCGTGMHKEYNVIILELCGLL